MPLPICLAPLALAAAPQDTPAATLVGRAVLPAATFAEGPTSGRALGAEPIRGQAVPFVDRQPVQGFSALLDRGDGTFDAMSDNGFGSIQSSADYHLRVYRVRPHLETAEGGSGEIEVLGFVELRDPDGRIPFPIVNEYRDSRVLTGADFDLESFQRAPDGTLWFGDEFGPFLLHTDAEGVLLEAPIPFLDPKGDGELRAPQNPFQEEGAALRLANAIRRDREIEGGLGAPVLSPWHLLLDDGDEATGVPSRLRPSADEGQVQASSEIFDVELFQAAGYPVVVWTVNERERMDALIELGVDGIITDRPDLLLEAARAAGLVGEDGLIDADRFDAQGHRGARNLRPENTLPAMEAALDSLMTTLELDCGVTSDGVAVLGHDPFLQADKHRRLDGEAYGSGDELLVRALSFEELQSRFVADRLLPGREAQRNELELSPVSVAFARLFGLPHAYSVPSLGQVYDFAAFYEYYYLSGPGRDHDEADVRARNAGRVRFNVEAKLFPTRLGRLATRGPVRFVQAILGPTRERGIEARVDLQSFDFRTLRVAHARAPELRTVMLIGDFPEKGGGGGNLQPDSDGSTPWLGGMPWPYRITAATEPFRVSTSGGIEGMALSADGERLLPMLEAPLVGGRPGELLVRELDLESGSFNDVVHVYPLHERGEAIGDFVMFSDTDGLVLERDWTEGDLDAFKAVFEVRLAPGGGEIRKRLAADLLRLRDPDLLSLPAAEGDVGLGERFAFPFVTIEDVVVLGPSRIGVMNDNNYPFSVGRHVGSGRPDDTELIVLELARPLGRAFD